MKTTYVLLLLIFSYTGLHSQQDTVYEGKTFHVRIYDDSDKVACIGNYLPHTGIRNGEWDYFYPDGKLYARTYFNKDLKTGLWVYYNEQGNITRDTRHHEKLEPKPSPNYMMDDIESTFAGYYMNAQQNKNASVQFSHGSAPLEYDEKLYPFKVNAIAVYSYWARAAEDAKEHRTRYYVVKDGKSYLKETDGKQYTNIEIKHGRIRRLNLK